MTGPEQANDWRSRAACRDHPCPDWWFPIIGTGANAIGVCRGCPVRRDCGQDAADRDERFGIQAGFRCGDSSQRDQLRAWLGMPPRAGTMQTCKECSTVFETRRRISLCPGCRDYVDSTPVREHLAALQAAGVSQDQIATAALVSVTTVRGLLYGSGGHPWRTTSRDKAERILAIPVPERAVS